MKTIRTWGFVVLALVLLGVLALVYSSIVNAAGTIVTTTADGIDAAANCANVTLASLPGPDGHTTLREADIGAFELTLPPDVTINQASAQNDPTNASPVNFTVTFSEPVTDFDDAADVTLSGTAGATTVNITEIAPMNGTTYNVAVSGMGGAGTVIATVPANAALNGSSNGNAASTSTDNTVTYDGTPPNVTINQAAGQPDSTSTSPVHFTAVFSEPVTGFDGTDVTLSGSANPTTATITPSSGPATNYDVAISGMNASGTITVSIPSGGAIDAANNFNTSSSTTTPNDTDTITNYMTPSPTLGNYPDTSVSLGGETTITPDAAPTITTGINVSTSTNFKGTFAANAATGVVRVTNAHPAGAYTVTVTAFGGGGSTSKTFTLTVQQGTACAGATVFTNAADVNVGPVPVAVAIGDFNNDGKQDMAVAIQNSNLVAIRLGDGLGGFSGTTTVSVGTFPRSVAVGDFNSDGKQDLAVANGGSSTVSSTTVSIRLGDGMGGFSGTTEVPVVSYPRSVAIGDFNNDGKQDFAAANFGSGSNTVSIRLGDGAGNFSGTTNVPVGTSPEGVAIGDFNNDGNQDIAAANSGSASVSIRLGDGAGNFSGTTNVPVGPISSSVAIGDFNSDGKQDFAATNANSSNVSIRMGDGAGNFSGTTNVPVGTFPFSVAIGDFNNDGKQDFAAANANSATVSIRSGDGAGNFSGANNVPTDSSPQSVAIGDFNNDGKQDFATANTGVSTVSIRLGGCNLPPTITAASGLSRTQSSPVSNSQIATVTDDGGNGSVAVTVTTANPSNGVTISNIQNTGGNVTANIVADCTATNASFTLQASDGVSTSTATLNVTVNANTAPTLTYTDPPAVAFNGSTTVTPTTATDNDSITGYSVQSVAPALTTAPTVNSSGVVSITNAQPAGTHTITIRATDSCGVATDASFTLTIDCGSTVVTNSNDNGAGSLRDVILHACPGATITFNMTPGNVTSPITLTSGELVIDKNLTITGPGANALAISGNNTFRLMYVTGSGVNLTTNNLSFTGGGGNQFGAAIHFDEAGTLTINDCEFYGNSDSFGGTVATHKAAAINVNRSSFRNNTTPTGINVSLTPANVLNSTISNNTGFGIHNSSSNLTLANSTIANNPSGILNNSQSGPASATLSNVLLSNNSGLNLRKIGANPNTFTSNGHNLINDNTFSQLTAPGPGDLTGASVQALLAPLAYNGGPTQTRALLPGSAALNAGDNTLATGLTTDQRGTGFNRVVNSTVDIGAFESRGFTITATSGTPQSTAILNAFGAPLIASVNGVGGEPVNGGIVTFTAPAANASAVLTGGGSTANVSIASGQASINATANGTAGSYNVSASAVGATSASFSLTNSKANTSTAVSSSVNPSDFGQSVTFTTTVTAVAGTPTGTVQFKDNGTNIGAAVNLTAGGVAQVSTSTLTVGTHTITADYSGDANFLTSAATLSGGQVVKSQPSLSINDVSITEGDAGTKVLSFTVTLSAVSNLPVSVDYATANGTATGGSDYVATNGTFTFDPSDSVLTRTVNVTINGDVSFETVETLFVNLSNAVNATISDNQGLGTIQNDDAQGGFISFSQVNYNVSEITGIVTVTVTRTNDVSQAANVDYATDDTGASTNCAVLNTGLASQRCDYTSMFGTLKFAANETQKTIDIPINLDAYTEGPETFTVKLSNPTGGAVLAVPATATVTISDSASPTPNAIDDTTNFVRQQYRDFLNREADPAGLAFWKNNIDKCNDPAQRPPGQTLAACIEVQRLLTSAAFFLSLEFKGAGGLVRDFYVAALDRPLTNNMPGFVEFMRDAQGIQKGVVVGQGNWQQVLDANRLAFMNDFVTRAEFVALYPTTDTPTQYVDKLYQHAKVTGTQQERLDAIDDFGGAATAADPGARARALLRVTQSGAFQAREMNRAFVQIEYFGYLRRNPNDPPDNNFNGFNFWVNKLNQFNGDFLQAEMVKAFLSSLEYRNRFGP